MAAEYEAGVAAIRNELELEKLLPPIKTNLISRKILSKMLTESRDWSAERERGSCEVYTLYDEIRQPKRFSSTPIEDLRPILIRDMFARKIHTGNYLLCRIMALPSQVHVNTNMGVEDIEGNVAYLVLANYPGLLTARINRLDSQLPLGSILLIREPFMQAWKNDLGISSRIRVDSPSDVHFLEATNPLLEELSWHTQLVAVYSLQPRTAADFKGLGKTLFGVQYMIPAAVAWTRGLDINPNLHDHRLNRCQAYIRLGWFRAALADAHAVLGSGASPELHLKALTLAARAEYNLDQFESALKKLYTLDDAKSVDLAARCKQRIHEVSKGDSAYDWSAMLDAGRAPIPKLDVADYVGPIEPMFTRNRLTVRATRNIVTGELLVVSKPFVSLYPDELDNKLPSETGVLHLLRKLNSVQTGITARLAEKLMGCPEYTKSVYQLYSGPTLPNPSPLPANMIFRETTPTLKRPLQFDTDIDIARLDEITFYNTFSPRHIGNIQDQSESTDIMRHPNPNTFHLLPSCFNHSCDPNAHGMHFGDVFVIRATRGITAGSEVTLCFAANTTYLSRSRHFSQAAVEECVCSLCTLDRADGEHRCTQREILAASIARVNTLTVAENYVDCLGKTYARPRAAGEPAPIMFAAHLKLVDFYAKEATKKQKATSRVAWLSRLIRHAIKALAGAGFVIVDDNDKKCVGQVDATALPISQTRLGNHEEARGKYEDVILMVRIALAFKGMDDRAYAEKWTRAAVWVHCATIGGGFDLFMARLGEQAFIQQAKSVGLFDISHSP